MPRAVGKVFKKRSKVFTGVRKQCLSVSDVTTGRPRPSNEPDSEVRPRPSSETSTLQANSEPQSRPTSSSSSKKLSCNLNAYQQYIDNTSSDECYDLVSMSNIQNLFSQVAVCTKCHGHLSVFADNRLGLSVKIHVKCLSCGFEVSERNSPTVNRTAAVNLRLVYAFRCIGKGEVCARNFCGLMNLPNPPEFKLYTKTLLDAVKEVSVESMRKTVEQCVEETGSRDITGIFDGSWQRRGHASQNGIVSAISETTGKVIDVRIMTKYCRCPGRLVNVHGQKCSANYAGVSGGMEAKGIVDMFETSVATHNIRYKYFLGDGDSSAYPKVVQKKPYGDDFKVEKKECVGHVQKRMGSRLRKLKQRLGKTTLSDGKTVGGRGRLTNEKINEIQNYYGLAIRRNTRTTLLRMKTAVWAEYFHLMSSNESPHHALCPKGRKSWCKYQKAVAIDETYDHDKHTHLSSVVMTELKPIFRDLAHPDLLKRCLHGGTQNASESLNSVIWSRLPKSTFVMRETLELGVYEAIVSYNEGNIAKCRILERLGISPGQNCINRLTKVDKLRIQKADKAIDAVAKKARQTATLAKKRLEDQEEEQEDPDNPSYAAGVH